MRSSCSNHWSNNIKYQMFFTSFLNFADFFILSYSLLILSLENYNIYFLIRSNQNNNVSNSRSLDYCINSEACIGGSKYPISLEVNRQVSLINWKISL